MIAGCRGPGNALSSKGKISIQRVKETPRLQKAKYTCSQISLLLCNENLEMGKFLKTERWGNCQLSFSQNNSGALCVPRGPLLDECKRPTSKHNALPLSLTNSRTASPLQRAFGASLKVLSCEGCEGCQQLWCSGLGLSYPKRLSIKAKIPSGKPSGHTFVSWKIVATHKHTPSK